MLPPDSLKDLLSQALTDRDKVLICLAVDPVGPHSVAEILALAVPAG